MRHGVTTPSDYGSRHPPSSKEYNKVEKELLGVETEEEDAEILIARLDMVEDAVKLPILAKYTDREYQRLVEDIRQATLSQEGGKLKGVKKCWGAEYSRGCDHERREAANSHQAQEVCAGCST